MIFFEWFTKKKNKSIFPKTFSGKNHWWFKSYNVHNLFQHYKRLHCEIEKSNTIPGTIQLAIKPWFKWNRRRKNINRNDWQHYHYTYSKWNIAEKSLVLKAKVNWRIGRGNYGGAPVTGVTRGMLSSWRSVVYLWNDTIYLVNSTLAAKLNTRVDPPWDFVDAGAR